jgi:hypothetical protein
VQYEPDSIITELIDATETGVPRAWRMAGLYASPGSHLELKDGAITYNFEIKGDWHGVVFKPEALAEFIRLADPAVSDERILAYAQEWGQLELCSVGLPRTHDPGSLPASVAGALSLKLAKPCPSGGVGDPERVDWWRYWARQANCLARILVALRSERLGAVSDWAELRQPGPWAVGEAWERALGLVNEAIEQTHASALASRLGQLHLAGQALENWILLADVRPEIMMMGPRASIRLRPRSLFGVLGLQLVFVAADIDGFALCHGCHAPIIPARRMGLVGHRVFCPDCRKEGRPQREAHQARYRRLSADPAYREAEAQRQRRRRADKRAADQKAPGT